MIKLILAAALMLAALPVGANPWRNDCYAIADIAIVARALAVDTVPEDRARRIMATIYQVTGDGTAHYNRVIVLAYRDGSAITPGKFAERIYVSCMAAGGDLGKALGTDA